MQAEKTMPGNTITIISDIPADSGTDKTFQTPTRHKDARIVDIVSPPLFSLLPEQHLGMLELLPDATVIANDEGIIVFVNEQAKVLFGYARHEMLGQLIEMLIPLRFRENHVAKRNQFVSAPRVRPMGRGVNLFGMRKDQSEFPVEIHLSPMQTKDGLLVLSSHRDISERKAYEQKIQQLNEELGRSNAELEQFAAIASHDLQEPLRIISSYTSLLHQRFGDTLDDKGQAYIGKVINGTKRMSELINAILNYSKVGHQGIKVERVESATIAHRALANLELKVASAGGCVVMGILPAIVADPVLMTQLLQNLVSNGLKFKSTVRAALITIACIEGDREWIFSVADNGIGIRPEDTERIFMLFQRLHSAAEYPGTGIGLATCKKIAERHGGRMWVESTLDVGTTFFFSVPK